MRIARHIAPDRPVIRSRHHSFDSAMTELSAAMRATELARRDADRKMADNLRRSRALSGGR